MGLGRLILRSAQLARQTGTPLLKELYYTFCVRPKLPLIWQDWVGYRVLGPKRFAREWMRKDRYTRWGHTMNSRDNAWIISNKFFTFDRLGAELMGRPHCSARRSTPEDILAFWATHGKLFLKPNARTAGEGVEVLPADLLEPAKRAKAEALAGQRFLLEPYLVPHPALREVMPDSLSSLRIHTIRHGDEVHLCLLSSIRFGRKGKICDHDLKSYTLFFDHAGHKVSPKAFCDGRLVTTHDDTGYRFENFRLPHWEASVALVKTAARLIPEHTFIGWDVALTADGPKIIEANYLSAAIFSLQHFLLLTGLGSGVRRELHALRRFARTGKALNTLMGGGVINACNISGYTCPWGTPCGHRYPSGRVSLPRRHASLPARTTHRRLPRRTGLRAAT